MHTGFNPRAPCGARRSRSLQRPTTMCFNPRAPCGARPAVTACRVHGGWFQSTRPMLGATPLPCRASSSRSRFNPRAPCGARPQGTAAARSTLGFNPRAPCGARPLANRGFRGFMWFQSTRPMRGATMMQLTHGHSHLFQSTRPMRGATRSARRIREHGQVSIHAPHAGRDGKRSYDFPLLPHIYGYYSPQI